MAQGTVKRFNAEKGHGSIAPDEDGADIFIHYAAIDTDGLRSPEENQRVEFTAGLGPKGMQADGVRAL